MAKEPMPTVAARTYTAAELADAKSLDIERASRRSPGRRIGRTGRLSMQIDTRAVMNAVDREGPEVLSKAGKEYWRDMRRMYPHIACGEVDRAQSANGMRCRHGRVTEKIIVHADLTKTVIRG